MCLAITLPSARGPALHAACRVHRTLPAEPAGLAPTVHATDSSGWAQETQRCALLIKRHALSPFAAPAGLAPTVQCCCLALAHCAALLRFARSRRWAPRCCASSGPPATRRALSCPESSCHPYQHNVRKCGMPDMVLHCCAPQCSNMTLHSLALGTHATEHASSRP